MYNPRSWSFSIATQKYPLNNLQVRSRLLNSPRLIQQVRLSSTVLACVSASEGAGLGNVDGGGIGSGGAVLESLEKLNGGFGGQILVVVVVDLDHGGVDAGAEAFDLEEGEETVLGSLALLDAEVVGDGLDNRVGTAAT